MEKSQLRKIIRESIQQLMTEQTSCDNSMAGSCAQTHLPPNMNWPNMTNFACTGTNTYDGLISNMQNQMNNIFQANGASFSGGNTPGDLAAGELINFFGATGGGLNVTYSVISQGVNTYASTVGMSNQQRGQLKRTIAKLLWSSCMKNECNC